MTDLTNEVLEAISDYTEEGFLAEAAVIQANIDACKRQLLIQEECENLGIVMEGDIIPERNGENILLYIFLFIPRLIINLINKIKDWLGKLLFPSKKLEEKKAEQEAEMARLRLIDEQAFEYANNVICKKVNAAVHKGKSIGFIKFDTSRSKYVFMWRIGSIDLVIERYKSFFEFFSKYDQIFSIIASREPLSEEASTLITNQFNSAFQFLNEEDPSIHSSATVPVLQDEFFARSEELKKVVMGGNVAVRSVMDKVMDQYREMESDIKKIPNEKMVFARKMINQIEQAYSSFLSLSSSVSNDFDGANTAFQLLSPAIETALKEVKLDPEFADEFKKKGVLL